MLTIRPLLTCLLILGILGGACVITHPPLDYSATLWVIDGATWIDTRDEGRSTSDIPVCRVVGRGNRILAVGPAEDVPIPQGASVAEAHGKYLVPWLIDSFATLNDASYARAYLYHGVTTIIGVDGGRRGILAQDCDPSPRIVELESVGYLPASTEPQPVGCHSRRDRREAGCLAELELEGQPS